MSGSDRQGTPVIVKKVAGRTFKNAVVGSKLTLVRLANRKSVQLALSMIPDKPEWMNDPKFESGLLWLGPTVLQVVNAVIEDREDIPDVIKSLLAEAGDLGQINASMETTETMILPFAGILKDILTGYLVAVGGKAVANLITEDMVMSMFMGSMQKQNVDKLGVK